MENETSDICVALSETIESFKANDLDLGYQNLMDFLNLLDTVLENLPPEMAPEYQSLLKDSVSLFDEKNYPELVEILSNKFLPLIELTLENQDDITKKKKNECSPLLLELSKTVITSYKNENFVDGNKKMSEFLSLLSSETDNLAPENGAKLKPLLNKVLHLLKMRDYSSLCDVIDNEISPLIKTN